MAISEFDTTLAGLRSGGQRPAHWHIERRRSGRWAGLLGMAWETVPGRYDGLRSAEWSARAMGVSYRVGECFDVDCRNDTGPDNHFHVTITLNGPNGRALPLPYAFKNLESAENFKLHTHIGGAATGVVVCSCRVGRANLTAQPMEGFVQVDPPVAHFQPFN